MIGDRNMNLKNEKGSIALFVLIALLFYIGFLLLMYANNLNKVQAITEKIGLTKEIYEKNMNNINEVYSRRLARNDKNKPVIKDIPSKIITNVTPLSDSYEEYGLTGGNAEYIAFDNVFTSLKELINYSIQNDKYGNTNIEIKAYGNNNIVTKANKEVEIVRGMKITNEAELDVALATTEELYICLGNDISVGSKKYIEGNRTYKLDLNNYKLSMVKDSSLQFFEIRERGNLTILDSTSEKNGKIVAEFINEHSSANGNTKNNTSTCIVNRGILNIESGRVVANLKDKVANERNATGINDSATGIANATTGTLNIKGGTIEATSNTNAITYLVIKDSISTSHGIYNEGVLNLESGNIISDAKAYMQRASGATVWGRTYAYAWGITNTATINGGGITYTINALADTGGTIAHDSDKAEIHRM